MKKINSQELAFFSMLETSLNFDIIEEKTSFEIDTKELVDKLDMSEKTILGNIEKLEKEGFLKVNESKEGCLNLDLSKSKNRIDQIFSREEIDEILKDFDYFIKKYSELVLDKSKMRNYIKKAKPILNENISTNINEIIKEGISSIFTSELILIIEKKLYAICEIANEKDFEIIEVILFCINNFNKEENPFYVTLFLASLYKEVE